MVLLGNFLFIDVKRKIESWILLTNLIIFTVTFPTAYCNSGYQKDINNQCMPCDRGYYKDNNVDVFSDCTLCPIDRITPSTKAESENDCTQGKYLSEVKALSVGDCIQFDHVQ
jgi:hypothetical protein